METLRQWSRPVEDVGALAGSVHGRIRFGALLGSGGLGEVYEATETTTGERFAVKTLLPGVRDMGELAQRLEREGIAGGLLDHPNIVAVHALDYLDTGTPYLVMELVSGTTVAALLRKGPLAPARALSIIRQTLDGLAHAHTLGVLHRDLKPDNLMITDGERVKILDLGLAKLMGVIADELGLEKLTETGTVFGTPTYMAPEQALGNPCSTATDLYALGVTLFEMVSGQPPFVASDIYQTMKLHVTAPIPTLGVRELDAIITRAMQKAPEKRFASAEEMRTAIAAAERSIS